MLGGNVAGDEGEEEAPAAPGASKHPAPKGKPSKVGPVGRRACAA